MTTLEKVTRSGLQARNIDAKKQIAQELKALSEDSQSVILMDYAQVKATEMQVLRQQARSQGVDVLVSKNTVARIAFKDTKYEGVTNGLAGQIVLLFSKNESGSAAKILVKSIKRIPI